MLLDYRNNLSNLGLSNENIIWKNKNKKNLFWHNWLWLLNIINELLVKQTIKDCTYHQSDKFYKLKVVDLFKIVSVSNTWLSFGIANFYIILFMLFYYTLKNINLIFLGTKI